jgi:hypothetical protein
MDTTSGRLLFEQDFSVICHKEREAHLLPFPGERAVQRRYARLLD